MKKWAFYKEGEEWRKIGLYAALSKEKAEPGQWRRRTYYSTHSPASVRLRMHIRESSKGTFSFAYNRGQEAEIERLGGGESLAHYLYKIAISELSHTTLKLTSFNEDVTVQLINAQTEKRVYIEDRYYDLDVFVKFTSQSKYQLKWNGELAIEIHNTNPVIGQKLKDLKALRIPVIEVSANKKLAYKIPEEYSTPKLERDYIDFLKGRLSEYLWSKVLSDPKSIDYLENENIELLENIKKLREQLGHSKALLEKERENVLDSKIKLSHVNSELIEKDKLVSKLRMQVEGLKTMGVFRFLWFKLAGR
tara:strand:- start:5521 stop:6438 length:918 start_codon:yes stop_codon:yes gene_type:complete